MSAQESVEWFEPTSGRVVGWIGVGVGAVLVGLSFVDGFAPTVALGGVLLALVCWLAMLRPRVGVTTSAVVLRGLVSTTTVPLAAVESVRVRQVLAIWVAGKRYVSAAVGHTYRDIARARRQHRAEVTPVGEISYADHVADLVSDRARAAREEAGVRARSEEQARLAAGVRRSWAWPEIAALTAVLATLAALTLG